MRGLKYRRWFARLCATIGCSWFVTAFPLVAQDFTVTTPGSQFAFDISNGSGDLGNDPTLTLVRGQTYTFAVNTSCGFHPFAIGYSVFGPPPPGVTNNNICSGTLTFDVPMTDTNYVYFCSIHGFGGSIVTVAPTSVPPDVRILNLAVGTNLVLTSTGTNTWTVVPQFKTSLVDTNWFPLAVQSNVFAGGTNVTYCGRPTNDAVFIRIQSSPQ